MTPSLHPSATRHSAAVVKFGGSLLREPALRGLLAAAESRAAVVVPGGGAFADAVREAQRAIGFGDLAAHRMAILAMEQAACLLLERAPGFVPCATEQAFARSMAAGEPAMWLPSRMAMSADLPASWEVTSDSLALWLAIRLGAPRLVLLKAAEADPMASPADLARAGMVDACFPALAEGFSGEIVCLGPAGAAALDAVLAAPVRYAA